MTCDCQQILNDIQTADANITIYAAAESVAHQQKFAWEQAKWYAQYNYYLCGCGGSGPEMAQAEKEARVKQFAENRTAIVERHQNPDEMAELAKNEALHRLHQLVMVRIGEEKA